MSENFYWYYTQHQNYYWLVTLPKVDLSPALKVTEKGDEFAIELTLTNSGETLSFFNEITLLSDGRPVDPVFWSDNFVTLFPGETKTLTAAVSKSDVWGELSVQID